MFTEDRSLAQMLRLIFDFSIIQASNVTHYLESTGITTVHNIKKKIKNPNKQTNLYLQFISLSKPCLVLLEYTQRAHK